MCFPPFILHRVQPTVHIIHHFFSFVKCFEQNLFNFFYKRCSKLLTFGNIYDIMKVFFDMRKERDIIWILVF